QYLSLFMRVNHSAPNASATEKKNEIDTEFTIRFAFGEDFCQIHHRLSDEIRLTRVISIARQSHLLPSFDPPQRFTILGRRRWWCPTSIHCSAWLILSFVVDRDPDFFVPLRMLSTTFDCLCFSFLAIMKECTVWVLLSDVPFIGQVFLLERN